MQPLWGGRAHFHLYRDQFSSDCQTVWDDSLLECNTAANFLFLFDHRICENLDFGQFSKKVWLKMVSGGHRISQKNFKKSKKMMKNFFFIFRSIMFHWMYRDLQTWYNDYKTVFIPTMQSECSSNHILNVMQKIYIFDIFDDLHRFFASHSKCDLTSILIA